MRVANASHNGARVRVVDGAGWRITACGNCISKWRACERRKWRRWDLPAKHRSRLAIRCRARRSSVRCRKHVGRNHPPPSASPRAHAKADLRPRVLPLRRQQSKRSVASRGRRRRRLQSFGGPCRVPLCRLQAQRPTPHPTASSLPLSHPTKPPPMAEAVTP